MSTEAGMMLIITTTWTGQDSNDLERSLKVIQTVHCLSIKDAECFHYLVTHALSVAST